ncbi:molybdate ABC transporter substrate-binding protein [Inquilinus sp. Marseille-Q2685]|uniref:molybdate ABC transporter substrate-binding protein n=1 Tax=Inquilinus sp. Marseille-Q2685 TaxID=2866581 RepID=UPI001CE46856|nr:molybdate ABC transporter substrate-binding protein [Inquilinus sp. Marseille-Q2685]
MRITRRGWLGALLAGMLGAAVGFGAPAGAKAQDVTVFAAASLKDALDAINAQWQADAGHKATISYAASSALAKQIEAGAPADVFISADLDWMNYLADRKLIKPETRSTLLGNRIVLVAPKDSAVQLTIAPNFELAKALGDGHLAMADVKAVPAGKYGQAALEKLGVWSSVQGKVAQAENVRATLALVSRGEAPLGIVYQTDAAADPGVKVVGTFPADSHPPILYPVAVLAGNNKPEAQAFVDYLKSSAAKPLFEKQGFTVVAP